LTVELVAVELVAVENVVETVVEVVVVGVVVWVVVVVVVVVVLVVTAVLVLVLVLVKLEVVDDLGDETTVVVEVVEETGLLTAELVEPAELEVTEVEGVMVAVTVCIMVVVEIRIAITVDAAADEEEPIEEAKSEDEVTAPVDAKPNVDVGGWPVMFSCVWVCVEWVDHANVKARLDAMSKNNGTHTRMAVATKSGRPSNILDVRPRTLALRRLILLRTTAR